MAPQTSKAEAYAAQHRGDSPTRVKAYWASSSSLGLAQRGPGRLLQLAEHHSF